MTIRELIDQLTDVAGEAPEGLETEVRMVSDYGDICHTQQALPFEDVRLAYLQDHAYSHSGQAVIEEGEDISNDEEEVQAYEAAKRQRLLEDAPIVVALGSACAWQEVRIDG